MVLVGYRQECNTGTKTNGKDNNFLDGRQLMNENTFLVGTEDRICIDQNFEVRK